MIDLDAYLARIGYEGPREATLATLRAVAGLHPRAIAFENVAVAAGGVPDISLAALEAKLVRGGRGGYCYEHNTLLHAALALLGFVPTMLLARVRFRVPAEIATARSHMLLRVDLPDGTWIVDAGFGGVTVTAPVALHDDGAQPTPHEAVRVLRDGGDHVLQARLGDDWADLYRFDLAPQLPPDIDAQNWHTATRPAAMFANNVIVTRPVAGGRYTLANTILAWRATGGAAERRVLADRDEFATALREVFALGLPEAEVAAAWEVAVRASDLSGKFL